MGPMHRFGPKAVRNKPRLGIREYKTAAFPKNQRPFRSLTNAIGTTILVPVNENCAESARVPSRRHHEAHVAFFGVLQGVVS